MPKLDTYPTLSGAPSQDDELAIFDESIGKVRTVSPLFVGPYLNAKAAGAVGDGVVNDTTALQSALDALAAAGGGVLEIPEGTFKINFRLKINGSNIWIRGAGRGVTIIHQTLNGAGNEPGETAADGFQIFGDDIKISDLTLRGAAGTNPPQVPGGAKGVIWQAGRNRTIIEQITIEQFQYRAIQCGGGGQGIKITNCILSDLGDEGVLISGGAQVDVAFCEVTKWRTWALDTNSSNTRFLYNYIHDDNPSSNPGDAGGIAVVGDISNVLVHGNILRSVNESKFAIIAVVAPSGIMRDVTLTANFLDSPGGIMNGVFCETTGGVLQQISFIGNHLKNARFYTKKISYLVLSNNTTTTSVATSGTDYGIRIDSASGADEIRHVITGNISEGWDYAFKSGAKSTVLIGNIFRGVVQDIDFGGADPHSFQNLQESVDSENFDISSKSGSRIQSNSITPLRVFGTPTPAVNAAGVKIDPTLEPSIQFGDATFGSVGGTIKKTQTDLGAFMMALRNPSVSGAGTMSILVGLLIEEMNRVGAGADGQLNYGILQNGANMINLFKSMIKTERYISIKHGGAPSGASTDEVKLYVDTSAGKQRLMALFQTGAPQVVATEP